MVEQNIPSSPQVIAACRANQAGNDGSVCVGAHTRLFEWPLSRVLLQPRPYSALTALPFSNFYIIHAHSICAWNIKNALWGHILSFKRACFVCSLISVTQRPYISGDFPRCLLGSSSLAAIISWSLLTALPHFTEITKALCTTKVAELRKPSRSPHQNAKWCKIL